MKCRRLAMDIDYADLVVINRNERADLDQLFDRMAQAGFDASTWDIQFPFTLPILTIVRLETIFMTSLTARCSHSMMGLLPIPQEIFQSDFAPH